MIIIFVISLILGGIVTYFYLLPKLKLITISNQQELNKRKALLEEILELGNALQEKVNSLNNYQIRVSSIEKEIETQTNLFQKQKTLYNENLDLVKEETQRKMSNAIEEAQNEYLIILQDLSVETQKVLSDKQALIEQLTHELQVYKELRAAAVSAAKREEEIKNQYDFYKLVLTTEELEDISKIRQVSKLLNNSEVLNKIIWKVYYEKPYTSLVGRVLEGPAAVTGIYKITNINNQMCYVGQAVNIADRWKQHIKRGIGAETPTQNKLYPAMLQTGVENFTFEVIQECSRAELSERETYWQEYHKCKEFGYSIK